MTPGAIAAVKPQAPASSSAPAMAAPAAPAAPVLPPGGVETAPVRTPGGIESRPLSTPPTVGSPPGPAVVSPSAAPSAATARSQPRGTKQPFSEAARVELARADAGGASGRAADERAPATRAADARPPEPRTSEAKAAEAKAADPRVVEPRVVEPRVAETKPADPPVPEPRAAAPNGDPVWGWPADGKVLQGFDESRGKGIAIAGRAGEAVSAAADGKVIFSGVVRGYGNLVIVKHASELLSVYAHNRTLAVREGDNVRRGQKIAEIGDTDADRVKLHFEIRRQGKPVDPARLLPAR